MRTASAGMSTHLQGEVTTLAMCWKATWVNGTVLGFTQHTEDITLDGVVYLASAGYTPSSISTTEKLNVDNLEVIGMLNGATITEADIHAGLWDYATVEIFWVNYKDLTQGMLHARKGWLGEVKAGKTTFIAELRGLTQKLQQTIGEITSPTCRAKLGDARCKKDLTAFTFTGTVGTVTSDRQFADAGLTQANGYFEYGQLTWLTGLNVGLVAEVKTYTVGNVILQLKMPYAVQAGDTYSIVAGCDGVLATCRDKFGNVVNMRAEPYVPGMDAMIRGPKR